MLLSLSLSLSEHIDPTTTAESSRPSQYRLDVPMSLANVKWLTDDVINAAQMLLKGAILTLEAYSAPQWLKHRHSMFREENSFRF